MTTSKFEQVGSTIGALVAQKQAAYGDSFGKSGEVMRLLYPDGIPPGKLDDALTVVRVLDKLFRIATDKDAFGESPWNDIAGYAILSVVRNTKQEKAEKAAGPFRAQHPTDVPYREVPDPRDRY